MIDGESGSLMTMSDTTQTATTISNIGVAMFTIADQDANFLGLIPAQKARRERIDVSDATALGRTIRGQEAVISALPFFLNPAVIPVHDPALITTLPGVRDWYLEEGCGHLSIEAFWQMSKVIEVRYDRFLQLGEKRSSPLQDLL